MGPLKIIGEKPWLLVVLLFVVLIVAWTTMITLATRYGSAPVASEGVEMGPVERGGSGVEGMSTGEGRGGGR